MWTEHTPDAGDPARIRRLAGDRNRVADRLEADAVGALQRVAGAASDGAWTGDAASAFFEQVERLALEFAPLLARLRSEATALASYAGELERLAEDASALRARERAVDVQLQLSTKRLEHDMSEAVATDQVQLARREVRDQNAQRSHLDAQWEELVLRRMAADRRCSAALAPPPAPVIGTLSAHQLSVMSDHQLLAALGAVTPAQLVELLRHDDALVARISLLKDSRAVAAWWGSLGDPAHPENASGAQLLLVGLRPAMLGNLDGVAYWARDQANRAVLTDRRRDLADVRRQVQLAMSRGDSALAAKLLERADLGSTADLDAQLDSLDAVKLALSRGNPVTYQLIVLDLRSGSQVPLAAISVGDLDRADQVTVAVPGVDTTVANSMSKWTETARNLWWEERQFTASKVAVVSWIGYDNPPIEVAGDHNARVGAESLASLLQGVSSSHGWAPGRNLSLVGHSYGATTAAFATELTPVDHLTMLASVGVDPSMTASDLQVPAGEVWASRDSGDSTANFGRTGLLGLDAPVTGLGSEHPVDVTSPAFHASIFVSDSAIVNGQAMHGADGHDAHPQVDRQLDPAHGGSAKFGYLDRYTVSLRNCAAISVGRDNMVITTANSTPVPAGYSGPWSTR